MKKLLASLALATALAAFAAPSTASAKGVAFFSHGDELIEIGPLEGDASGAVVGSFCQHFALFWANIWTWDCKLVMTDKMLDSYSDIPAEIMPTIEAKYKLSDAKRDPWNKFGIFVIVAAIVGFGLLRRRGSAEA